MPADGLTTGYANQHLRRPLIFIELPSERLLSDVTTLLTATQLQQSRESDCYSVVPARDLLRSPPSEFFGVRTHRLDVRTQGSTVSVVADVSCAGL